VTPLFFNHVEEPTHGQETVLVSDLSGGEIEEGKAATTRITFDDARRWFI
jgi:hypothetical protein